MPIKLLELGNLFYVLSIDNAREGMSCRHLKVLAIIYFGTTENNIGQNNQEALSKCVSQILARWNL